MPPTLKEYKDRMAQVPDGYLPQGPYQSQRPPLDVAAEVRFVKLTGSPEWDSFLARLQAKLNEAEAACEAWGQQALVAVEDKDIRRALYSYHECNARVNTLKEIMQLPQELIDAARGGNGTK